MTHFLAALGRPVWDALNFMGSVAIFFCQGVQQVATSGRIVLRTLRQIHVIGSQSLFLIVLISLFCGMVLGLQGYYTLIKFGSVGFLGSVVSLSLIRELGPVLTAIMLTGRAGSSMTAEIGVMRISDQIDALDVMDINSVSYLVSPRLVASVISFPLLTAVFDVVGIVGFGLLVTTVCCHQGYFADRRRDSVGPEAVGNATTSAVVIACVLILAADYVLTSLFL